MVVAIKKRRRRRGGKRLYTVESAEIRRYPPPRSRRSLPLRPVPTAVGVRIRRRQRRRPVEIRHENHAFSLPAKVYININVRTCELACVCACVFDDRLLAGSNLYVHFVYVLPGGLFISSSTNLVRPCPPPRDSASVFARRLHPAHPGRTAAAVAAAVCAGRAKFPASAPLASVSDRDRTQSARPLPLLLLATLRARLPSSGHPTNVRLIYTLRFFRSAPGDAVRPCSAPFRTIRIGYTWASRLFISPVRTTSAGTNEI